MFKTVLMAACVLALCLQQASVAQPTLASNNLFGGSADQFGTSVSIRDNAVYLGGYNGSPLSGQLVRYAIPPGSPLWSSNLPGGYFYGVTATTGVLYAAGGAVPSTCGAADHVGDIEGKSIRARYDPATGALLGCASTNYFPYQGSEGYDAVLDGSTNIYVAGAAETCGFGNSSFVLSKLDLAGNLLQTAVEQNGACIGRTDANGIALLNGNLYVAGDSKLSGEDGVFRPVLLKYGTDLARLWRARPTDSAPGGAFLGVTSFGGAIYAVGYVGPSGSRDYLIEKYDESGTRLWSKVSGGSGDDVLNGVVGIGNRVYAVGSTNSQGAGGTDGVILEIDPASGSTLSTTLYGGALDDSFSAATTDGTDLYVAGSSRSFASPAGNVVGQSDMVLARYRLGPQVCVASSALDVVNYQLVSQRAGNGSQAFLTYRADLLDTGTGLAAVSATLTGLDPFSVRVVPGQDTLNFAPVPGNSQVTSSNTFTIIVDTRSPFDFTKLHWAFTSAPALPVASAGPNQTVPAGTTVKLDASISTNPSCIGELAYSWMFTSRPAGSSTREFYSTGPIASFIADVPGNYVIRLTVTNGVATSNTTVTITATP